MRLAAGLAGAALTASVAVSVSAGLPVTLPGSAPAAGAAPVSYVALGDSYTSGPGILPLAPGAPLDCGQSAVDYPHLTAGSLGLALIDRSCSGATTASMTAAQHPDQPPQFGALTPSTGIVTIGIGGNDHNVFIGSLTSCVVTDIGDPFNIGAPCQAVFGRKFADQVAADGPVIGAALTRIHQLSPAAHVFVVGYGDILPQHGNCYWRLPLTTGDVRYLDGVERGLNATLAGQAATHAATFVDTYTPSIGHDVCRPESTRWIEPLVPSTDAAPVHPNARGEAADAADVTAALRAAGVG